MNWTECVIDASLSNPEQKEFCFCPIEGDFDSGNYMVIEGMNSIGFDAPWKVRGIVHPDGEHAIDRWMTKYKKFLFRFSR